MKLIVGLGNPGEKYANTRHNVGFWVVDKIASIYQHFWSFPDSKYGIIKVSIENEDVILLRPMTFMNLSGEAVGAVMRYYKIDPQDVWIISDDLYHEVGTLRVRKGGSAGGHNGLKSVISHIGEDFWRYRLGVGPQPESIPAEDFVLASLDKNTKTELEIASVNTAEKIISDLKYEPKDETMKF